MTFQFATTSTRRAKPSHEPWNAHGYQRRASSFLQQQGVAALFLDPGLGKTSIVLDAFLRLKQAGLATRMLVIAPLRVCQTVWRQEGQRWTEFRDLRFSLLHGPKKAERLKDDADVWLINPEGVAWLAKQKFGTPTLPWDTVVLDELTKFKNHSAGRHKTLRPRLKGVARKWGLTGTPAPNGMMDLFGQFLILDDGAALGRYITHFRALYFQVDYDGFSYNLMPGAEKRIEEKIRPYVLRMSAEEYLELPPVTDDIRLLELDAASRSTYLKMKKDMLAELPEGTVTGANAAAVYSKLAQMANGAVYVGDQAHTVSKIHDTKLEALDDLIEELAGQQLLLAYEFNHDLERLRTHYGDKFHYIGAGAGEKKTTEIVDAWNRGDISLLACHPASAAHGLNLQHSSCGHVAWFSPIWDLELYQQFIRRIRRQGNEAQRIVNHLLCVRDTIDELKLTALRDKDVTQERLLQSLNAELTGKETPMSTVQKLSRQGDAGGEAQRTITPKGWGRPATAAAPTQPTPGQAAVATSAVANIEEQRERIQQTLTGERGDHEGPSPAERARAAFSPEIRAKLDGSATVVHPDDAGKPAAAATTVYMPPSQEAVTAPSPTPDVPKPTRQRRAPAASAAPLMADMLDSGLRLQILDLAVRHHSSNVDSDVIDVIKTANDMWAFVAAA